MPASPAPTVINVAVDAIVSTLNQMGVDGAGLAEAAGIDRGSLESPSARIDHEAVHRLWVAAIQAAGDPGFGLSVSRNLRRGNYEGLFFAMLSSATVRQSLLRFMRFQHLIDDNMGLSLVEGDGRARFSLLDKGEVALPAEAMDCACASLIGLLRDLTGDSALSPIEVELRRQEPGRVDAFERLFAAPIRFEAEHDVVTYRDCDLDTALPMAHGELALQSEKVVQEYLARVGKGDLTSRVRHAVVEALADGPVAKEGVAKRVGMSPRSMQRHLDAAGTTFREVVREARCALAVQWLEQGRMSVTEIALLLGFSDASSFARAFRRWTGKTPSDFSRRS